MIKTFIFVAFLFTSMLTADCIGVVVAGGGQDFWG